MYHSLGWCCENGTGWHLARIVGSWCGSLFVLHLQSLQRVFFLFHFFPHVLSLSLSLTHTSSATSNLTCVYVFLSAVVVSRIGLWKFDLCETQLMQEGISDDERLPVNSVQGSLSQLGSVLSYVAGVVFSDPKEYFYLVTGSCGVVTTAAIIYTIWCCTPGAKRLINIGKVTTADQ